MKKLISIVLISILLFSCSQETVQNEIIIEGKVLTGDVKEIKLYLSENRISLNDIEYSTDVKKDSSFSFTIPTKYSLSGIIGTGHFPHPIFLTPGDNLKLQIENDRIKYQGKGSERNNFLEGLKEIFGIPGYGQILNSGVAERELGLSARSNIDSLLRALKDYNEENIVEPEFNKYYILRNKLEYDHFMIMLSAVVIHAKESSWNLDSLNLPKEYLVKQYIDDSKLISRKYFAVMKDFIYTKIYELSKGDNAKKHSATQIVLFDSLKGESKDYAIAKWLDRQFDKFNYDKTSLINPGLVTLFWSCQLLWC